MKRLVINVIGSQIGWFSCVLGAAHGLVWLGPTAVALVIAVHLALHPARTRELIAILLVATVGTALDMSQHLAGLITFGVNEEASSGVFALWLSALWINFAAVLSVSLRWLGRWPWAAASLGGISGPMTYYAGSKLGAIGFGDNQWLSLTILAVQWAVVLPAGLWIVARIYAHPTVAHETGDGL